MPQNHPERKTALRSRVGRETVPPDRAQGNRFRGTVSRWVDDLGAVLCEANRVLQPRGRLVVVEGAPMPSAEFIEMRRQLKTGGIPSEPRNGIAPQSFVTLQRRRVWPGSKLGGSVDRRTRGPRTRTGSSAVRHGLRSSSPSQAALVALAGRSGGTSRAGPSGILVLCRISRAPHLRVCYN